jgi:hypothetical protein
MQFTGILIVPKFVGLHARGMSILPAIELSDGDKLDTLRRFDQFRKWHSLDDTRFCLSCGNLLTGRDILVVGGTRGTGPLRIVCPTERCNSIPMDWALPTDEVLSKVSMRRSESVSENARNLDAGETALRSSLRWFAQQFKRSA